MSEVRPIAMYISGSDSADTFEETWKEVIEFTLELEFKAPFNPFLEVVSTCDIALERIRSRSFAPDFVIIYDPDIGGMPVREFAYSLKQYRMLTRRGKVPSIFLLHDGPHRGVEAFCKEFDLIPFSRVPSPISLGKAFRKAYSVQAEPIRLAENCG